MGEGVKTKEELRSKMMDVRYSGNSSQIDKHYVKEVQQYAAELTAQNQAGAQG